MRKSLVKMIQYGIKTRALCMDYINHEAYLMLAPSKASNCLYLAIEAPLGYASPIKIILSFNMGNKKRCNEYNRLVKYKDCIIVNHKNGGNVILTPKYIIVKIHENCYAVCTQKLGSFIAFINKDDVDDCLSKSFSIEAIGSLKKEILTNLNNMGGIPLNKIN